MHCNMEYYPCPFKAGHSAIARSWNCGVESLKFTNFISVVNVRRGWAGGMVNRLVVSFSDARSIAIPLVSFPFTPEERNEKSGRHSTPLAIGVWALHGNEADCQMDT